MAKPEAIFVATFRRQVFDRLLARLEESPERIQAINGPRQVGKTTMVRQVLREVDFPAHYASADDPALRNSVWLAEQWEEGRRLSRERNGSAVLAVDEIQKVTDWAQTVKRLWDEDRGTALPLRVVLLGSAALLVQKGLSESLAGDSRSSGPRTGRSARCAGPPSCSTRSSRQPSHETC